MLLHRTPRIAPICRSYLDSAPSWYDSHTRVFYCYYLGRYRNQPLYCYGYTNDLDTVEFNLKKTLPMYERVMYVPCNDFMHEEAFKKEKHVTLGIEGTSELNIITCDNVHTIINIHSSIDMD